MIEISTNMFLVLSGLLIVSTLIVFIVFAIGNMADKYNGRTTKYWRSVIGSTLDYLSVAGVFWGIGSAICLFFFTIGLGFFLAGRTI